MNATKKLRNVGYALILIGTVVFITNSWVNRKNNPMSTPGDRDYFSERWQAAANTSEWQNQLLLGCYVTMVASGLFITNATRREPVDRVVPVDAVQVV